MWSKIGFFLLKGFSRMPFWLLYALSGATAWTLFHMVRYRRRVVESNLGLCFPEKTPEERHEIARKFYRGFCDTMFESLKMFSLSPEEAVKRLRYEDPEAFSEMLASGHNHIMIFGHYANWEWLMFTKLLYPQLNAVALYQRIENEFVNRSALHARERFGMEAMQAKHALLGLSRLKNDGNTMVAFVADQSPARPLIKYWVDFFGVKTPAHIGAHQLAVALKYDVIFLDMQRTGRGHYSVKATRIYSPGEEAKPYDVIDRFFALLEEQIRHSPQDWLWSHRRWKYCPRKDDSGNADGEGGLKNLPDQKKEDAERK